MATIYLVPAGHACSSTNGGTNYEHLQPVLQRISIILAQISAKWSVKWCAATSVEDFDSVDTGIICNWKVGECQLYENVSSIYDSLIYIVMNVVPLWLVWQNQNLSLCIMPAANLEANPSAGSRQRMRGLYYLLARMPSERIKQTCVLVCSITRNFQRASSKMSGERNSRHSVLILTEPHSVQLHGGGRCCIDLNSRCTPQNCATLFVATRM